MYSPHHILYNALNFSQEIMVMSRKTDRRTLYTKAQIKKAYVEALHHKPMDKITVSELCKTSEINRSTFYLHYQDTYAVLEELLNEVLDSIEIPQKDFFKVANSIGILRSPSISPCWTNRTKFSCWTRDCPTLHLSKNL